MAVLRLAGGPAGPKAGCKIDPRAAAPEVEARVLDAVRTALDGQVNEEKSEPASSKSRSGRRGCRSDCMTMPPRRTPPSEIGATIGHSRSRGFRRRLGEGARSFRARVTDPPTSAR